MPKEPLALIGEHPESWMAKREERADPALSLGDYVQFLTYGGLGYPFMQRGSLAQREEWPDPSFEGYAQSLYRGNGVVFACMTRRMTVFSEARFQFQRIRAGRPGNLYGNPDLAILERPWPNATTGDLLARAIQDADIGGNFYAVRRGGQLFRLRPDWVTVVAGSRNPLDPEQLKTWDINAELVGYIYQPGGPRGEREPEVLDVSEVCHFAPIPDPSFRFRGMSWLTPIIREVLADQAATMHKYQFFINGATPNMVVSLDPGITKEKFDAWTQKFEEKHSGVLNAYKTLYLGGGAKAEVVGANLQQIDFKVVQGAGETRVAAAAGVPPVLAGLSEGLAAATYSNYGQARRAFGDMTIRPLWRNFAGSMASIVNVPSDSRLWYDDRDIPFLREDATDAATIAQIQAATIQSLIIAGYKPESVVQAVTSQDFSTLQHTGLYSVQLQPPGTEFPGAAAPSSNGKPAAATSNGKPPAGV